MTLGDVVKETLKVGTMLLTAYAGMNMMHFSSLIGENEEIGWYCTAVKHGSEASRLHEYFYAPAHIVHNVGMYEGPVLVLGECGIPSYEAKRI